MPETLHAGAETERSRKRLAGGGIVAQVVGQQPDLLPLIGSRSGPGGEIVGVCPEEQTAIPHASDPIVSKAGAINNDAPPLTVTALVFGIFPLPDV